MSRALLVLVWSCLLLAAAKAAPTFLFDATKAETVANADWVIDEDNHVAGRYPTPPASGITASTPETYWTGALSSWGVALVQLGYNVEQLPVGGRITYGDGTNVQDLSNYQVYVVCEPNILFTAAEKLAMIRFVQAGGSLFVISDHAGSDRNNDGYDSVQIWNDFFTNNGVQTNPFGVAINSVSTSLVSSYYDTAADDPLTNGPVGPATTLEFDSAATLTLNPAANASVRAAFWTGATHTNGNVMMAWGTYGAGRFVVETDSSPVDDGTGSSGHTLYYGWTEQGLNVPHLFLNASVWLAAANSNGAPANDNFANAIVLSPNVATTTGTNVNATREAGEPNHAGVAGGASVWWQFTAANSGTATLTTAGSDFDTLLAVYTGTNVGNLAAVASNDNADGSHLTSAVSFPATAGTVYHVAVDGANGATGHVTLNATFPPPANDNFAQATPVNFSTTGGVSYAGNNVGATAEAGEPNHDGYVGGRSVWWTWTAPFSGGVTVSTLNSNFVTLLAIYTGTNVSALTPVAGNAGYGRSQQSQVSFSAVAGTTYAVAVDGYQGAAGNVVLTFTQCAPAPANDNFANATVLTGTNPSSLADNSLATKETGESNHGNDSGGHSVWWKWTAPGNGTLTVSTAGSSFDTTLGVYTGTAVNALTTLGENDDSNGTTTSLLSLAVTAGTTYDIAVDGYSTSTGTITLNLSLGSSAAVPANDNFANATVLTGTSATATGSNGGATAESGEPYFAGGGHSVWWSWTAPGNLAATVSTYGSNFDTTLLVGTGSAVSALTLVGSNDDYNGTTSQVTFNAQAGVTYAIRVDGYSSYTGSIALSLTTQPIPTVGVVATMPQAAELNQVPGVFTFTLSQAISSALTINLTLTGTATNSVDYSVSNVGYSGGQIVTIPAGQTSAVVTVTPVDDNDPTEGTETVIASLVSGTGYQVNAAAATATVTIQDDSPYSSAWESTYRPLGFSGALAAPLADPDGDGIPNLLEFAFNLNPLAADGPAALSVLGSAQFTDANGVLRRFATLIFTRRTDAPNLTYAVETTTDPTANNWDTTTPVFASSTTANMPANTEQATYRAPLPMDGPNAAPRQFLRVRVTAAPPQTTTSAATGTRRKVSSVPRVHP